MTDRGTGTRPGSEPQGSPSDARERIARALRATRDRRRGDERDYEFLRDLAVDGLQALDEMVARPVELWINCGRFAGHGLKPRMTGVELRYLPIPPIPHGDDLYLERPGDEDLLVSPQDEIEVAGRRFFSVPRIINAG